MEKEKEWGMVRKKEGVKSKDDAKADERSRTFL